MNTDASFVTYVPPVAVLLFMAPFAHSPWDLWRVLGAGLILMFMSLLTVARLQLGNSFSVVADARSLVTSGIYSRIRHPIYVFSAFIVPGFALYLKMPWIFAILLFILPMQFLRALQEEKVLLQFFGEAYQTYRKTTWF